jgi:hypothetical protein
MLEIILIVVLSKKIASMASDKGRTAAGYVVLFIVGWLGGEFIGAVIGVILNRGQVSGLAYLFALLGAAVGAGCVFTLVSLLPPVEDEDYDRPRRRRRRRRIRGEDEYEEERRPRRRDDDDDESYRDKFRTRRSREAENSSEDDEDETRYRRKRRGGEDL